ncbi:hypothetical protein RB12760 [Rhodopirellula baltica SH 1]|uniref:Uncharacterized protein n=1 Tax=Rhodopirellula baltica (strain DSM 10527 / NCIMB 13988 / SH1) TaxID=243090 RepID=Q7UI48_RHOBA|nr:hypothetical protein RB12760 [Rhodopirellula baltica SH 1]
MTQSWEPLIFPPSPTCSASTAWKPLPVVIANHFASILTINDPISTSWTTR